MSEKPHTIELPFEVIGRSKKCFVVLTPSNIECFITVNNFYKIMTDKTITWKAVQRCDECTGRLNNWIAILEPRIF